MCSVQTKSKVLAKDTSPSLTEKSDKSDSSMKKLLPQNYNKNKSNFGDTPDVRYTPIVSGSRKLHENLVWSSSGMTNRGSNKEA